MSTVKNLKKAEKLVKTYRSITLSQLTKKWDEIQKLIDYRPIVGEDILMEITGFGRCDRCILCKKSIVNDYCFGCIYTEFEIYQIGGLHKPCNTGVNEKTYRDISDASAPEKLLKAIRARATHINKLIRKLKK